MLFNIQKKLYIYIKVILSVEDKSASWKERMSTTEYFAREFILIDILTVWNSHEMNRELVCARNVRDDGEASTHVQDYE